MTKAAVEHIAKANTDALTRNCRRSALRGA